MLAQSGSQISNGTTAGRIFEALHLLLEAFDFAEDTDSSRWDFAVEIQGLRTLGLRNADIRWLIKRGYVEHAREVTPRGDDGREFRSNGNLSFCRRTCFVLTEAGVTVALSKCDQLRNGNARSPCHRGQTLQDLCEQHPVPCWDADLRRLQFHGQLVKRFKWPAVNQETVLCAFQEESWPERIDDPLQPQAEQDSKRRLADTIKCLNRKQANKLILFRGDGTGEGVIWERLECGVEIGNS